MKYSLILNIEKERPIDNSEYNEIIEKLESVLHNDFQINIKLYDLKMIKI